MAKSTIIWDSLVLKGAPSTDLTAEILAINTNGVVVKRPAIDTAAFMSSTLTSGRIFVGNVSNVATGVAMSGVIAITNAGVTSIVDGSIIDADVNASAAIATTKLAAQTPSRLAIFDSSGFITASSITTTVAGYLDPTSSVQTQLNSKLGVTLTSPANGDLLKFNGVAWVNLPATTNTYVLTLTAGVPVWAPPTPPAIPLGGTTGQYLNKIDATDLNMQWSTLVLTKITDVTALVADVNLLAGAAAGGLTTVKVGYLTSISSDIQTQLTAKQATITGAASTVVTSNLNTDVVVITDGSGKISDSGALGVSSTELGYINGLNSNAQSQLDGKQTNVLTHNYVLVGSLGNLATPLAPGAEGTVFTITGGVPTWTVPGSGVADGDYGDVTISGGGTAWSVDVNINKAWTGTHSFLDNSFSLKDNGDTSKILAFQVSGITTATTRTLTVQDVNGTVYVTGGSDVAVADGGTNISSYAVGDLLQASGATTLAKLASVATGNVLISGGVTTVSSWGKVGLTTHVSGQLSVANGGTGVSTIAAKSIWLANSADTITSVTPAAGQSIRINSGNTAWEAFTPSPIISVSVTLNATQIGSAFSSPVTLLAAQGANTVIQIIGDIWASTDYTSAAWATNTNGFVSLGGTNITNSFTNLLTNAADSVQIQSATYNSMGAGFVNVPLLFSIQTGNPTGGGTNTLTIHFSYRVITVP